MPVPKGRLSHSRKHKRSANKNIKMGPVGTCVTCQAPIASHQVCKLCGYYKGVKVLRTRTERMHARGAARAAQQAAPANPESAE